MVRVFSLAVVSWFMDSRSAIELHLPAPAARASLLVDGDRRRDVLERRARAVEHDDLVGAGAAWMAADHHIGELRMHLRARHEVGGESMLQLADLRALIEDIDDEGHRRDERGLELLLALAIRADRCDEHAGADVSSRDE